MSGEISSPSVTTGGRESAPRLRWFACGAAVVAWSASLWAAMGGLGCMSCRQASALLPGISLAWGGVAAYAALAVMTGGWGLTRWARGGFFAAAGVHVVLLSLLARQEIFCAACVVAGGAALVGGAVSLMACPRAIRWGIIPFAGAAVITFVGSGMMLHVKPVPPRETATTREVPGEDVELPDGSTTPPVEEGHVRLVLFEREGCKHCVQFEEDILPPLKEKMGATMEIERREPTLDMETPTIVVVGKGSRVFTGVPDYQDLEAAAVGLR